MRLKVREQCRVFAWVRREVFVEAVVLARWVLNERAQAGRVWIPWMTWRVCHHQKALERSRRRVLTLKVRWPWILIVHDRVLVVVQGQVSLLIRRAAGAVA